jgi:RimJ/RimL family protein N-acetyltransferase
MREAATAGPFLAEVWLRVVPWNEPALACYRAAGFVRAAAEAERLFNEGQPQEYVWMQLPREHARSRGL